MSGLSISKLSKAYANIQALDQVSFEVATGEVVAVLGPSGSGKSTLLALIAGLEAPDAGQIAWDGADLGRVSPHERGFGLMFQDYLLFPHKNVFENVAFGLRMAGGAQEAIQQRVAEVLTLVGLPDMAGRDVNGLSGGEQQRVALARALALEPRLLMLDEPLGSLDRALRERLMLDLKRILAQTGQTTLYVTHDQEEAYAIASRIVILEAGRVAQIGTPQEIYRRPNSVFVARFLGLDNLLKGKVGVKDGRPVVQTPIGEVPVEGSAEGEVIVLLRPDAMRLEANGGHKLEGRVSERSFRGGMLRLSVAVKGQDLSFDFPASADLPEVGERIRLYYEPAEAVQVFEAVTKAN